MISQSHILKVMDEEGGIPEPEPSPFPTTPAPTPRHAQYPRQDVTPTPQPPVCIIIRIDPIHVCSDVSA